ncbi:MAG: hypothetical protein ACRD3P_03820 [Terriglobales bacterium]
MRKPIMLLLSIFIMTACLFAKDPVGDWQTVQDDIPRGWQITVVTAFTFPCIFQQANTDELVCEQLHHRWGAENNDIHVRRDRIQEIRVEKREGANMFAGAIGGGAAGALLGAVLVAHAMGPAALLLGMGGAGMGASTGRGLHMLHGKVIYRRAEIKETSKKEQTSLSGAEINVRNVR